MKIKLMLFFMLSIVSSSMFALISTEGKLGDDCSIASCQKGTLCREVKVLNGTIFRCLKEDLPEKKPDFY